jgi:hypothetical protein
MTGGHCRRLERLTPGLDPVGDASFRRAPRPGRLSEAAPAGERPVETGRLGCRFQRDLPASRGHRQRNGTSWHLVASFWLRFAPKARYNPRSLSSRRPLPRRPRPRPQPERTVPRRPAGGRRPPDDRSWIAWIAWIARTARGGQCKSWAAALRSGPPRRLMLRMDRMDRMDCTSGAPVTHAKHGLRRRVRPCVPWLPRAPRWGFLAGMGAGNEIEAANPPILGPR